MATYKSRESLVESQDELFDGFYKPEAIIFHSGIYQCMQCGHEIAGTERQAFPRCGHHTSPHTV